jgi:hypothetical protein
MHSRTPALRLPLGNEQRAAVCTLLAGSFGDTCEGGVKGSAWQLYGVVLPGAHPLIRMRGCHVAIRLNGSPASVQRRGKAAVHPHSGTKIARPVPPFRTLMHWNPDPPRSSQLAGESRCADSVPSKRYEAVPTAGVDIVECA